MMKRVATLLLLALPGAAGAQAPQAFPGLPPAPRTATPSAGITANGFGIGRTSVKTVQFVADARGNASDDAVLRSMREAGIDDPVVGPMGSQISRNGATMLRGTVHDVSRVKLERIAAAAAGYVQAHPGTSIDNVNFSAQIDCAAVEQAARSAAFAEARRKAEALAALGHVTLAGVSAIAENSGCPGTAFGGDLTNGGVPFDLGTLTASITVFETVTYAIEPGDPSRRRRPL